MNASNGRSVRAALGLGAALGVLLVATPGGAFHLEDGLRGRTLGNQVGGSLTMDGWHVTDRRDRIWYALPRLVSGSVEFTLSNVTMSSLGTMTDNELFAMYEGGYGITEPIEYSPDFRVNHYKCMLRVYANDEDGRAGQQKLMWGMCPSGAPGYGDCGCGSFFEEPFGGNGTWDGSPQRLRIEWRDGRTRYLRNGAVVLTIDWSDSGMTFAPSSLHMSLGTSRPSGVGGAQLPVGAVFSDLVVDGVEGELARCPGSTVRDAGTPMPDAGTPMMSGMVMDFPAVEDVTVTPLAGASVYPEVRDLSVGAGDSEFYLKFRVGALPGRVVQAQLLLNSSTDRSAEGDGASVFAASNASWSEGTLTWSARPGPRGPQLGRVNDISVDQRYTLALPASAVPSAGTYAFAVLPAAGDANSAHFDSKEVSAGRGPVLRLVIDPSMPPLDAGAAPPPDVATATDVGTVVNDIGTPPTDVGAVTNDVPGATDTGMAADAATVVDAGEEPGEVLREVTEGGCGCHAGGDGTTGRGLGGVALAALALVGRRRRRVAGR
ncbi:MAG: DNRLRE domain-containing protein [Deltaproteobacteria bacterium]|nr:DNRLRE domain-containing protein [Myxococcales bacterium]MDP3219878.1 DNRLRE domain-containing protein [Deltaproteobacteria bacterium]